MQNIFFVVVCFVSRLSLLLFLLSVVQTPAVQELNLNLRTVALLDSEELEKRTYQNWGPCEPFAIVDNFLI